MVINEAVTLTGSYNWTRGAAANSENLNLVSSATVAAAYVAHWHNRLAVSVRFERREDWCRASRSTMQLPGGRMALLDSGLRRFLWRIVDGVD
jgi:hypothetical protein